MVMNVILILMMVGIAGALVMMRMKPKQQQPVPPGPARRPLQTPVQTRQPPAPQQRPQPRPAPGAPLLQVPAQPATPVYPPVAQSYPVGTPAAPVFVRQQPVQPAAASPAPVARPSQGAPTAVLAAPAPMLLEVTTGPEKGIPYMLMQGDNHLGRAQNCQIRLTDSAVSNRHAIVRIAPGQILLFDNASTNGTFVNGNRVMAPMPLQEGDQITIGQTTMILRTQVAAKLT